MQLLNILLVTWFLKGIWELIIGLVTIVSGLLDLLWASLDLGFSYLGRAFRSLWRSAFPPKSPAPSGQGFELPSTLALKKRAMSGRLQPATACATNRQAARSSQNPPLEAHAHTTQTMDTSEDEIYQEACQEWLHNLPPAELPPIIDVAVSQFRNGLIPEEEALKKMDQFRFTITQWKNHNSIIEQVLNKIPDED